MFRATRLLSAAGHRAASRPVRGVLLVLGVTLASGIALAAWSATEELPGPSGAAMLPPGPVLERLLDQVQASPVQRAQARQIFAAADADLRRESVAERADRARMARLFGQDTVDEPAIEALRRRIEQRHDLESRRATQALVDVGLVLNARQRQAIAGELADGPRLPAGFHGPAAAPAVRND
jgi:Spy/CpxP family protein refolding chaperone